jgi:dipeptidyl-peptidase-4
MTTPAAGAAPLTPERVFASPALAGPTARGVALSPDGAWVAWLQPAPDDQFKLDLWAAPTAGGEARRLISGRDDRGGLRCRLL